MTWTLNKLGRLIPEELYSDCKLLDKLKKLSGRKRVWVLILIGSCLSFGVDPGSCLALGAL